LVERVLGKDEVTSSILVNGSTLLDFTPVVSFDLAALFPLLNLVLLLVLIVLAVLLLKRKPQAPDFAPIQARLDGVDRGQERVERALQADMSAQRQELATSLQSLNEAVQQSIARLTQSQRSELAEIRADTEKKLEQIRLTVDEKLQGTLETRLGQSFKQVSERLEQVHRGLGEMQTLATGVGDLRRVLTNVRVRGMWGEVQLGSLLDQILAPEQYARNVATTGTSERVEFALKLPGRDLYQEQVWLPIDSKFPIECYQRLAEASERADPVAVEVALKELERNVEECARTISTKYIKVPSTTDFAILFLATEGLYAEVHRRHGLAERIQQKYRVSVAGPSALAALLNSLQMGFRTLAIEKRSSEVWKVLGEVKTEFGKYAIVLEQVKKKLDEATNKIDEASTRTRAIDRRLKTVESEPSAVEIAAGPTLFGLDE
jgi:DNA recombination protein RmuC